MESESLSDVVILTCQYAFSGKLDFGERRLSEFLNDPRDTVVVLQEVSISRVDSLAKVIARQPEAVIPKHEAALVLEQQLRTIPLDKRYYHYVKKEGHSVFLVVDGMQVEGFLHTSGRLDLRHILRTSPDFLPITQPIVSFHGVARYVVKPDAVMVNKRHIQYLARPEPPASESNKSGDEAQPQTQV